MALANTYPTAVRNVSSSLVELVLHLPAGARVLEMADTGHFVHIERPQAVADLVLEFLG